MKTFSRRFPFSDCLLLCALGVMFLVNHVAIDSSLLDLALSEATQFIQRPRFAIHRCHVSRIEVNRNFEFL